MMCSDSPRRWLERGWHRRSRPGARPPFRPSESHRHRHQLHERARTVAELRPSAQELSEVYTPTAEELVFIRESARGPSPTLTVAVLLKSMQRLGYLARLQDELASVERPIRLRVLAAMRELAQVGEVLFLDERRRGRRARRSQGCGSDDRRLRSTDGG